MAFRGVALVLVSLTAVTGCGSVAERARRLDDPTYEGPPKIEATIDRSATESEVFATLGTLASAGSAGVETVDIDMKGRRVVIRLMGVASEPVATRVQVHEARGEILRLLRGPGSAIHVTKINWNPAP
jgi:hypothetical protein